MGTRAVVRINNQAEMLYKHFDGDDLILDLNDMFKDFPQTCSELKTRLDSLYSECWAENETPILDRNGNPIPYESDLYLISEIPPDVEIVYDVTTNPRYKIRKCDGPLLINP